MFELLLPFRDIGQNLAQALVLDNRSLIDLLQLVEHLVGQVMAFVLDRYRGGDRQVDRLYARLNFARTLW